MSTSTASDPRPLVGEPTALDLLNTRWVEDGVGHDLLTDTRGLAVWLASNGLESRFAADEAALEHVLTARAAIASAVDRPGDAEAASGVDAVLEFGCVRPTLTADGPGEITKFDDPAWGPAWTAAYSYLRLLRAPDRIRACAHPSCVLHFFDTSRNGTRRWCSMAVCGNRAKASRHHARSREN